MKLESLVSKDCVEIECPLVLLYAPFLCRRIAWALKSQLAAYRPYIANPASPHGRGSESNILKPVRKLYVVICIWAAVDTAGTRTDSIIAAIMTQMYRNHSHCLKRWLRVEKRLDIEWKGV
jgi:hypothetical protein